MTTTTTQLCWTRHCWKTETSNEQFRKDDERQKKRKEKEEEEIKFKERG